MTTPRERREQRAAEERRKELPGRITRSALIGAIALVVVGAIAAAFYFANEAAEDCPVHWHATLGIFVEDGRVTFPQPPYNLEAEGGSLPMSMHMHHPNQELLHFEPGSPRCRGVGSTLDLLGVDLSPGRLVLEGAHAQGPFGGTYEDDGNRTVRVHIQMAGEAMREETIASVLGYQLRDGEKIIVTHGAYTREELQAMLDQLAWPFGFDANGRAPDPL